MLDVPPQQLVTVSIPLGGFLKNTELLQGVRVKKGQVIATIENIDFIQIQQDYLEAKNQFEFARADYERQTELSKENINAQKTLQQAQSNFATWQAKSNALRAKLGMLNINISSLEQGNITNSVNIYSPINGYVTEVNVNIGKYLQPNDILFEIVNTEHLHAELTIFEKDIPKIRIGQKVRFKLANESTERLATIYLIGRKITSERTIRIHCHIDTEDAQLLPGMYLKANVETGGAEVPSLPDEAIVDYQGKKYIFTVSEKSEAEQHFTMQEIQTGNNELGYTEIMLPDDSEATKMEVVVKGAYALLSKMKNSEEEGHGH
jgi:cobalt-zinc-cadmium efflux system membrane fusion protein